MVNKMTSNIGDLITLEEVRTLRAGAKTITPEMVMEAVITGVAGINLSSGYRVSMTIDLLAGRTTAEHIAVSKIGGITDPADAEIIAKAVIGECTMKGNMFNKNVIHFLKIVEDT